MSYKITDETGLAFNEMERKFNASVRRTLNAGARTFEQALIRNTPKSSFDSRRHAKENIAVSNVRTDRSSFEKYMVVGYKRGVSHRIHATEFGTMYQRPQGFITKTYNQTKQSAWNAMLEAARRQL